MKMTNEGYWEAQDPRVQAIRTINTPDGRPDEGARETLAHELYDLGFNPDYFIWVKGLDADLVMNWRAQYEVPWVNNMEQPPSTRADFSGPQWPRSITTKTDAADYPPFTPPVEPVVSVNPVGPKNGGVYSAVQSVVCPQGVWAYREGDACPTKFLPVGETSLTLHRYSWPFGGQVAFWEDAAMKAARLAGGA